MGRAIGKLSRHESPNDCYICGSPAYKERVCQACRFMLSKEKRCGSGEACGNLAGFGQFAALCKPCWKRMDAIKNRTGPSRPRGPAPKEPEEVHAEPEAEGIQRPAAKPKKERAPNEPDAMGRRPREYSVAQLGRYVQTAGRPVTKGEALNHLGLDSPSGAITLIVRRARELGYLAPLGAGGRAYKPGPTPAPAPDENATAATNL